MVAPGVPVESPRGLPGSSRQPFRAVLHLSLCQRGGRAPPSRSRVCNPQGHAARDASGARAGVGRECWE